LYAGARDRILNMTRIGICEGFEVRVAAGGRVAVHEFAAAPPDLIVLDIGLPDAGVGYALR
jgi:DNA-binding response OmpR family regulator